MNSKRHIGLWGATSIGVGAIVGGGILALAGAAFSATGASAVLAFGLNGVIAVLCVFSFAEVAARFPQSGGTYAFAKRVLSVESAFTVGWVVWFASIVAAALYAIGFGKFTAVAAAELWPGGLAHAPDWLTGRPGPVGLACLATIGYAILLCRRSTGGGNWINIGKVLVFLVLILGGFWAMSRQGTASLGQAFVPFFSQGLSGLAQAMGFSFIALQGFDLVAAVGGSIRDPARTIPRAMFYSLGIALVIYIPLLIVVAAVGVPPGTSIQAISSANPDTLVAVAVHNYLGPFGYWLVIVAAILSTLSALQANLLAASHVAKAMATDRNLPRRLAYATSGGAPRPAIILTAVIIGVIILLVPNVSAAGAASSLIFLITFALAHWIAILVRQRAHGQPLPFRSPWYPLIPIVGGVLCLALAIYQGIAVPSAGLIALVWLVVGGILFLGLFAHHARVADASASALDPDAARLRGLNPLLLLPIANPDNARSMVSMARAISPPGGGRVLLLSVIVTPPDWRPGENPQPLQAVQNVIGTAIQAAVESGLNPESLATISPQPWREIARVAKSRRCESLLLGLSRLEAESQRAELDQLLQQVDCDVVVLRAAKDWTLSAAQRVLIPLGGRGGHERLLARLLGSMGRSAEKHLTFIRVVPDNIPAAAHQHVRKETERYCHVMTHRPAEVDVVTSSSPIDEIVARAKTADLIVLGSNRGGRGQPRSLGRFVLDVARRTTTPLLVVCHRR